MRYSDAQIIDLWLGSHPSPHTQGCYRRDSARLLAQVEKPLSRITLVDLQGFAQSLNCSGLAPISCARMLAATKKLIRFLLSDAVPSR
jgi:site-specific recombinase XerD